MKPANASVHYSRPPASNAAAIKIFLIALAVRWIYVLAIHHFMGDAGLQGNDSASYISSAKMFVHAIQTGSISGAAWFGTYAYSMPLFHWLSTAPFLILGEAYGILGYVLLQGMLDAGTCLIVYHLAGAISPRLAIPAAIAATLNPTQIVLSGLFFTDTPFVFFVALSFLAAWRWSDTLSWRAAIALGAALGCAALVRVLIAPWAFIALAFLAIHAWRKQRPARRMISLAAAGLVTSLCLGITIARNVDRYGEWALTPQGGDYLTLWVVPLAQEAQDRTPYATTKARMIQKTTERFGRHSSNPFEQSRHYRTIGRDELKTEIRLTSLVKSWATGAAVNLAAPACLLSPPVLQIPHSGFYGTPGRSTLEKIYNYTFRSGNTTYTLLLLLGSAGVAVVRVIQLLGLLTLKRLASWPAMLFGAAWIGYILVVNGPIASPKYRLPLEPIFNILTGAGLLRLSTRSKTSPVLPA